jgi:hypothetical protein
VRMELRRLQVLLAAALLISPALAPLIDKT